MDYPKINNIKYPAVQEFDFMIKRTKTNKSSHVYEIDLHHHKELEIYVNLTGDVSFLVENNLYPLTSGDIIIARPGQLHHCVYRSEQEHNFFWILFDISKNEALLDFFHTEVCVNYISPDEASKKAVIQLCNTMLSDNLSGVEKFYCFFELMHILKENFKNEASLSKKIPNDLTDMLAYIDAHIAENIRVADLANAFFLSESTVKRRFLEYLDMTPIKFIQKKKMIYAAELIKQGETVLNAGINTGYADNSYFINLFRRYYGVTPKQYQKNDEKVK